MLELAPKQTEVKVNWYDAKMYCAFLEVDGKNDWRLPTKAELKDIYKSVNGSGSCHYYWSSTEYDERCASSQGDGFQLNLSKDYIFFVRAVRDI